MFQRSFEIYIMAKIILFLYSMERSESRDYASVNAEFLEAHRSLAHSRKAPNICWFHWLNQRIHEELWSSPKLFNYPIEQIPGENCWIKLTLCVSIMCICPYDEIWGQQWFHGIKIFVSLPIVTAPHRIIIWAKPLKALIKY